MKLLVGNKLQVIVVAACFTVLTAAPWKQDRDMAAVLKVVQRGKQDRPTPRKTASREAQTIKISISGEDRDEALKLSFPLALIEWFADLDEDRDIQGLGDINWGRGGKVSLRSLLEALRKLGPAELLEIEDEETRIRIWLE